MTVAQRSIFFVVKLLIVAAGYFCLNYTKAFGVEERIQWANAKGMPAPSNWMFLTGVILLGVGALLLGRPTTPK